MRIGLLSFGGPAGQIAVMHRVLVEEKRWISEQRFLHALNYCMLLPGPEAQQLATYVGWLLHGTRGGLVAGTLFVLPGFLAMLALSFVYVMWQRHPVLDGIFLGLKAAVVALVADALLRIGARALRSHVSRAIALAAFVAIAVLHAPFPLIVLGAGVLGFALVRGGFRGLFDTSAAATGSGAPTPLIDAIAVTQAEPTVSRAWKLLALWLPLWFAPVMLCLLLVGAAHVFSQLGVFFSQMAVVSFGGAYAVLSYVAQQAVGRYGWITPGQMIDGLGLAETTPGPLILVVQFVGFLAAYQVSGGAHPLLSGFGGALLTVWVTFVPCFLWIFLGAPYVEKLRGSAALSGALAAITAAVVGVIANLGLWFAVHALFAHVSEAGVPELSSVQWIPVTITVIAILLTFVLRWNLGPLLLACILLGAATPLLPSY